MIKPIGYTVKKSGDNYTLCFNGLQVESGLFATHETALKHKAIAENERRNKVKADREFARAFKPNKYGEYA